MAAFLLRASGQLLGRELWKRGKSFQTRSNKAWKDKKRIKRDRTMKNENRWEQRGAKKFSVAFWDHKSEWEAESETFVETEKLIYSFSGGGSGEYKDYKCVNRYWRNQKFRVGISLQDNSLFLECLMRRAACWGDIMKMLLGLMA